MNKLSHQIYTYRDKIWNKFMVHTSTEFKKKWTQPQSWNLSKIKYNKNLEFTIFLSELIYELFNISIDLVYFLFIFADKYNIIYLKNLSYDYISIKDANFNKVNDYTKQKFNKKVNKNINMIVTTQTQTQTQPQTQKTVGFTETTDTYTAINVNVFKPYNNTKIDIDCNSPKINKYQKYTHNNSLVTSSCFTPPESNLNNLWIKSKFINNLDDINNIDNEYFEYNNYYIDKNTKEQILNKVYTYLNNNNNNNNVINDNNVINNSNIDKETFVNNSFIDNKTINDCNDIDMIFRFDEDLYVK